MYKTKISYKVNNKQSIHNSRVSFETKKELWIQNKWDHEKIFTSQNVWID